jgi:hypothetical protein
MIREKPMSAPPVQPPPLECSPDGKLRSEGAGGKNSSATIRFFSNPWVGFTGTFASILGVFLAIIFYSGSVRHRHLVCMAHPMRTAIVRAGESPKVAVRFQGKDVPGSVTSVQIAFWNNGDEPIREVNVLRPLVIRVGEKVPILEAIVRKMSREVAHVRLDEKLAAQGELSLTWDILEKGDGAVVQIVFMGTVETPLSAEAIVEGQGTVGLLASSITESSPDLVRAYNASYEATYRHSRYTRPCVLIGSGAAIIALFAFTVLRHKQGKSRLRGFDIVNTVLVGGFGVVLLVWGFWSLVSPPVVGPPFGF